MLLIYFPLSMVVKNVKQMTKIQPSFIQAKTYTENHVEKGEKKEREE